MCETLNPKITLIIEQFFPQIVDRHISTRSPVRSTLEGLERYRNMGYQVIRNLSGEEREENRKALDDAYAAAVGRLKEFHDQETGLSEFPTGTGSSSDAS